jgi:hypothetical protein
VNISRLPRSSSVDDISAFSTDLSLSPFASFDETFITSPGRILRTLGLLLDLRLRTRTGSHWRRPSDDRNQRTSRQEPRKKEPDKRKKRTIRN